MTLQIYWKKAQYINIDVRTLTLTAREPTLVVRIWRL